ncbi:MAG: hypothetical protein O7G87_02715, partial [bacterium]|nr:hypothetical protein [bacterium]
MFKAIWMVLALSLPAMGQEDPASFSVRAEPVEVRVGETVTVWIDVTLNADWHIYSATTPPGGPYPTEIVLAKEDGFQQV